MEIALIRHGSTKGNLEKRYIGITEESLCEQGRSELAWGLQNGIYPCASAVYCSPRLRCIQTAETLYPDREKRIVPEFAECDFGIFEGKNYRDLSGNAEYQAWIDSGGTSPFPDGESREEFVRRSAAGFEKCMQEICRNRETGFFLGIKKEQYVRETMESSGIPVFIVHGGTIMALLSALGADHRDYYDYRYGNGACILCDYREGKIFLKEVREQDIKQR